MMDQIIGAFDGAAGSYDGASHLQEDVARWLMAEAEGFAPQRILDIGCGTGVVTALAARRWPEAALTAVDASPAMVAQARHKVPQARFFVQNAAHIDLPGKFDLILSSMMLHWLPDPAAVARQWLALLAPEGRLVLALPVEGSLEEWKALCARHRISDRIWRFPPPGIFAGHTRQHSFRYDSVRDFLDSMKHTGASSPALGTEAMPIASLRALLRSGPKPFYVTFRVLYTTLGP